MFICKSKLVQFLCSKMQINVDYYKRFPIKHVFKMTTILAYYMRKSILDSFEDLLKCFFCTNCSNI